LESKLHAAFGAHRVQGEWFKLDVRWPRAVGDAALRLDGTAYRELLWCLEQQSLAGEIVAEFEYEEDEEEADLWRSVCEGYEARAKTFGLAETDWDVALRAWRAAA
jgi:hypothetical protein